MPFISIGKKKREEKRVENGEEITHSYQIYEFNKGLYTLYATVAFNDGIGAGFFLGTGVPALAVNVALRRLRNVMQHTPMVAFPRSDSVATPSSCCRILWNDRWVITVVLTGISWCLAPFLFNPYQFHWDSYVADWDAWQEFFAEKGQGHGDITPPIH